MQQQQPEHPAAYFHMLELQRVAAVSQFVCEGEGEGETGNGANIGNMSNGPEELNVRQGEAEPSASGSVSIEVSLSREIVELPGDFLSDAVRREVAYREHRRGLKSDRKKK